MLSCYSRRLLSLAWRSSQCIPVSVSRNDFCSSVKQGDTETVETAANSESVTNIEDVLRAGETNFVQKACSALVQISQMKKENKISEADYKKDERFVKMLKTLESDHVRKAENMLIISSLKVNK